jgi:hypothetical protein
MPIPFAVRSKEWACGSSVAGIAGSNTAGGVFVCVVCSGVQTKGTSQDNQNKKIEGRANLHTASGATTGPVQWVPVLLNGSKVADGRAVKLTTHLHPIPALRMSGAISPLPIYAVMMWAEIN